MQTWTVKLFEARTGAEFLKTKIAADSVEQFGVSASNSDGAKRAAREWLKTRGHRVRAVSVSAAKGDVRVLIAYVSAGSSAEARALAAQQKAKALPVARRGR